MINTYISYKQVHFAIIHVNAYRVFLSTANAIAIVNTCSIARIRNRCMSKTLNSSYSLLLSCQKFYAIIQITWQGTTIPLYEFATKQPKKEHKLEVKIFGKN